MFARIASIAMTACLFVFASISVQGASGASGKSQLVIELNRLDAHADACRSTFVITNGLETEIRELTFEIVLFGKDQKLLRLASFALGMLPKGKTVVHQFDVSGIACGTIGRALLNAISQCDGEGLDPAGCLARVRTTSRAGVELAY